MSKEDEMSKVVMKYSYLIKKIDSITEKSNTIRIEKLETGYKVSINGSVLYLNNKYYDITDIPN